MFNVTNFLKHYNKRTHWNYHIDKFIKSKNKLMEFNKDRKYRYCSTDTAISFIENYKQNDMTLKISNDLYKRKILELQSEATVQVPPAPKQSNSLESEHFNIYGVSSIQELAKNIIIDLQKVKIENIKYVFIDYVYFFTYHYKYNTIQTYISLIRSEIKNSTLSDEVKDVALSNFKFSSRVSEWLSDGGKVKRVKNMTEVLRPIEVSFLNKFIFDSKKYIDIKINKANKKLVFTHLSALVALSIGRRVTEFISQSTVTKVDEYKVQIDGLGKKQKGQSQIIVIPTLFLTADEVIKTISSVQRCIPAGLKYKAPKDKYAHNLADFKLIDKTFWVKGSKFSSLRAIYAVVSELIYNQNNIIEENRRPQATYIQQLLGHGSEDFETYQYYYKRQVLLKNFNLQDYLQTSKTAML